MLLLSNKTTEHHHGPVFHHFSSYGRANMAVKNEPKKTLSPVKNRLRLAKAYTDGHNNEDISCRPVYGFS
jgi:hypothetical protein